MLAASWEKIVVQKNSLICLVVRKTKKAICKFLKKNEKFGSSF